MHAYDVYLIASILGVLGAGALVVVRFAYKRGATERENKMALDANTQSNKDLAQVIGGVVDLLNGHEKRLDRHDWRLDEHDRILERFEATPNVSNPAHRNASSA